jgi:predicted phage terminase large subunit-like protein
MLNPLINLPDEDLYNRMCELRELQKHKPSSLDDIEQSDLGIEVRRRAKADLYFFFKYFIGFEEKKNDLVVDRVHRPVCDLFVKKDDSKPIGEQDWRKDRLLLYPRGSFKSIIDVADAAQWILNFPNITILFMTASKPLAVGFLDGLKTHFVIKQNNPSFMNLFFSKFCVDENKLDNAYQFYSPQRTFDRKEPTVMASSIESTLSGFHFEVMKVDDVVSNINSENELQLRKTIKQFHLNRKMLMLFGYLDIIGTRYDDMDLYGEAIEKNVGNVVSTKLSPCQEIIDNQDNGFRILIGKGVVLKPGFEEKTYVEAGEEGCDLLFPEYLSYPRLMKEWRIDEVSFEGQINNTPRQKTFTTFDRPLLLRHTVPFTALPLSGPISITWDFAFSKQKGRDYSTACVAIYNDKGQMFIIDLIRDRFKANDLAEAVVKLAEKWRPQVVGIEDCSGSRFLEPAIIDHARKNGSPDVMAVCAGIDWFAPDGQKDAKRIRMSALHPWLVNDRLFFVSHLPYLEVLYKEFELCLSNHHHDDIPDVISQQPRYAPRLQQMIEKNEIPTLSREDAAYNILFESADCFGRIGMGWIHQPLTPPMEDDVATESQMPGLENILGAGLIG